MRVKGAVCMAALAVCAAVAAPAGAGDAFRSRVTISEPQPSIFQGRVISPKPGCERNRLVKVWYDNAGSPDFVIGEDRTDAQGRWRYEFLTPGDEYYASVARVRKGRPGHRYVCRADRSPSI